MSGNVLHAFRGSETVILGLDGTNPQTISTMSDCQVLQKNGQLSKEISPELYKR